MSKRWHTETVPSKTCGTSQDTEQLDQESIRTLSGGRTTRSEADHFVNEGLAGLAG
jgi:hypothetical protein